MKKIIIWFFYILIILSTTSVIILSTTGIETTKFNKIVSEKISENNKNVLLKLKKIKFKIDIKKVSLFLNTDEPTLIYGNQDLPIQNIKVYLDFKSFFQAKPIIKTMNLETKEIQINELKKILINSKPSNLTSFIINNVNDGKLITNIEFFFNNNFEITNFIAKGEIKKAKTIINRDLMMEDINFEFFADRSDILIKNIFSKSNGVTISEGNLQIQKDNLIKIKSDFFTNTEINNVNSKNFSFFLKRFNLEKTKHNLISNLSHNLEIVFDDTYKVINFEYKNKGKIKELFLGLEKPLKNIFFKNEISNLSLKETDISTRYSSDKKNFFIIDGDYQINDGTFNKFNLENKFLDKSQNLRLNFNLTQKINFEFINYFKDEGKIAKIFLDLKKNGKNLLFNNLEYKENSNLIKVKKLKISREKFVSFENIEVKTFLNENIQNNFKIKFGKTIRIKGDKYDGKNLGKFFNKNKKQQNIKKLSKNLEIEISEILTPLSKKLNNFRLIGSIQNGQFVKISSKGDFGNNKFLDITLKSDKKNKKKYLEIYSDFPQPLLSEYNFFKGLTDGTLIFSSIIDSNSSNSKLIIENFKVVNAPALVKLLSLADLGGLADLAQGEGLSFEKMEINMSSKNNVLTLNELYAEGSSISVLMEGYKDLNVLSLKGTLVPAKNLNKLLSKIPLIGDIIIPKETGEGLFGVSFKMKGPPGKVKTTINPIKTITPRFITKALEKFKKTK